MTKGKLNLTKKPIWERQPGETQFQFMWFGRYLEQRISGGSLTDVCRVHDKKLGYERTLRNMSYLNQWVTRIDAYRDFLDVERQKQRLKDIQEMGERQAKNGVLMQQYAIAWFAANPDIGKGGLTPELALKFMETGARIERTARGAPTEIKADAELPEDTRKRMESIYSESLAALGENEPEHYLEQKEEDAEEMESERG